MKKLSILLLSLLIIFIGFLLYKKIDLAVDAYNYDQMSEIDLTHVKALPVDERDVFESYTHQLSTYPLFDHDILDSTIHYSNNFSSKGVTICHIDGDEFVVNSFQDQTKVDKEVKNITGPYVMIWPKKYTLKSGVQGDIYETEDLYYLHVIPSVLEDVWFEFDTFSIKLHLKDL